MAVMSESKETQSGQLLIWQPRRKKKKKGRKKVTKTLLNNDICFFNLYFRSMQPNMHMKTDHMLL